MRRDGAHTFEFAQADAPSHAGHDRDRGPDRRFSGRSRQWHRRPRRHPPVHRPARAISSRRATRSSTSSTSSSTTCTSSGTTRTFPSDIEQMPHLYDFLKDNGTFDTNDHTILISHTGGGILSLADRSLSGPARAGCLERVRLLQPGRAARRCRLLVVVQVLDRQHRRRQPGEQPADAVRRPELQHGQRRPGLARRHRRGAQRARAVGAVHAGRLRRRQRRRSPTPCSRTTTAIILRNRRRDTTLAAASAVGDTNIKVEQPSPDSSAGQTVVLETGSVRAELATIPSVGASGGRRLRRSRPDRSAGERAQQQRRSHRRTPPTRPAT